MSITKKALAAAIVGGLFAGSAQAAVDISGPAATNPAVRIASEAVISAAGLPIANAGNNLDLVTKTRYSFSAGEVRYARFECSSNMKFTTAAAALNPLAGGNVGAINGLGTNAISFSITASGTPVVAADTITIDGTRTVSSKDPVSCSYGLYDTPSQAQAGGSTGRIAFEQGAYLVFANSYDINTTPNVNVADVEAVPSFSEFVGGGTLADIGYFDYNMSWWLTPSQGSTLDPATGALIDLATIVGAGTKLVFDGNFRIAGVGGVSRIYLSDALCTWPGTPATTVTTTTATFVTGTGTRTNTLCLASMAGGITIPVADYTVALVAVSAGPNYVARSIGPKPVGKITRNGTELQAPLAQVPAGWISRMVLTNTSTLARPYTISVMGETGNTIGASNLTGSVPAEGTVVVDLNDVLNTFTAAPRATLNVTVAGPDKQIQGLYQIVNPASGSISNHAMLRPGKN